MKLTLAQALKMKNRLVSQIKELDTNIKVFNIREDGTPVEYNTLDLFKQRLELTDKLVKLKTAIAVANQPIVGKIYEQAELKGAMALLKGVVTTGRRHRASDGTVTTFTPMIDNKFKDMAIKDMEVELDKLQDELDTFNHSTQIEIED
jgi:hypothetical protein